MKFDLFNKRQNIQTLDLTTKLILDMEWHHWFRFTPKTPHQQTNWKCQDIKTEICYNPINFWRNQAEQVFWKAMVKMRSKKERKRKREFFIYVCHLFLFSIYCLRWWQEFVWKIINGKSWSYWQIFTSCCKSKKNTSTKTNNIKKQTNIKTLLVKTIWGTRRERRRFKKCFRKSKEKFGNTSTNKYTGEKKNNNNTKQIINKFLTQ